MKRIRAKGLLTSSPTLRIIGMAFSRSERDRIEAKMVLVCSTGATEKNIDTVIDRRFKRHGQSWTTEGVNNSLKLRTLWYSKSDWDAFWSRQAS